jgi:Transport and Golgi organisation 2
MCTLTVHRTDSSLLVTMNRDEARFRAPEMAPQVRMDEKHAVHWLAPTDSQAGGTWFGVNEYALHACLLNRYMPEDIEKLSAPGPRPSRGQIIVDVLTLGNEQKALVWLDERFDPEPYPSFHLVVMSQSRTRSFAWNGKTLEKRMHDESWLCISSSSWRTEDVLKYRQEAFQMWVERGAPKEGLLPSFHIWQPPDRKEWAPLMDREISATRSITQTSSDFTNRSTEMRYWPRESLRPPAKPLTTLVLTHAPDAYPSNPKLLGNKP